MPEAPVTVPPAVTFTLLMTSDANASPPVAIAIVPSVVSLFEAASDPEGRPASDTTFSPRTSTLGRESSSSEIVTVAVDVSPSPSVIIYWNVTTPSSPGAGV